MKIVSFAQDEEGEIASAVAQIIYDGVNEGTLNVSDELFISFVPCIFSEGNLDFLRLIADECFEEDKNRELVNVFLDYVEVMIRKGERLLNKKAMENGTNS